MSAAKSVARPLKKSETLEIRIPYSTKTAFMARCRDDGSSASEALRKLIDQHLADEAAAARAPARLAVFGGRRLPHLIAGALIAAAVGAVAVPSLARPACPAGHTVSSVIAPALAIATFQPRR
jgi:hypothetical protein